MTLAIAEEMGLSYDASSMADHDCHVLLLDERKLRLVELSASWARDDEASLWTERFAGLRPYVPAADVLDIFRRELNAACRES